MNVSMLVGLASTALGIQISEIMYHPALDEDQYEWLELYNEASSRRDIGGWSFTDGITFTFPENTVIESGEYLIIASDPNAIKEVYGITKVYGPFEGRLSNAGEHLCLCDKSGAAMVELTYGDRDVWPVAPDGTGHSLTKIVLRGNPMDPTNWQASQKMGGTPASASNYNQHETWEEDVIAVGDLWRYFKGRRNPDSPGRPWYAVNYDDTTEGWLVGPTGIGYGDGDDATVLSDMRHQYLSVFCRKTFAIDDLDDIESVSLNINYDDGVIVYLNGIEVVRASMPAGDIRYDTSANSHEASGMQTFDLSSFKNILSSTNVLAIGVHNTQIGSSDLSMVPKLTLHYRKDAAQSEKIPVVFNEIHFQSEPYLEFYNSSEETIPLGGYYLSLDPTVLDNVQIPAGTVISGKDYLSIRPSDLGFSLEPKDSILILTDPQLTHVIDAQRVEPRVSDLSVGRWPNGSGPWQVMEPTPDAANVPKMQPFIVINEIMYHPFSNLDEDEYIELYNAQGEAVSLAGWKITGGIEYSFPKSTIIPPDSYLVIARDRDRIIDRYGLPQESVLGNYQGKLSNESDTIILNGIHGNIVDQVTYWDGGRWSNNADGYGSSLELTDPWQDNNNYQVWRASDETEKAEWIYVEYQAPVLPLADMQDHEIQLHLMGPGVTLIDELQLFMGTGSRPSDYLGNGGFEKGTEGWMTMGTHRQSHVINTDAKVGNHCLKIMADRAGDIGANHIEKDCDIRVPNGTATLSFWAKWQSGSPILVTRFYMNELAETTHLPIPELTGTPGAVNSVYQSNSGPLFIESSHSPVVPTPTETVMIRSKLSDLDGVESATIYYKADADAHPRSTPLNDKGIEPDKVADDGIYTGEIPPHKNNETVAFYLEAVDKAGFLRTWPEDINRPALYRVAAHPWHSPFPTYRVIMTAEDQDDLYSPPHMSNAQRNCTFIFNEQDVYHQCGIRLVGSSYHRRDNRDPAYTGHKIRFNNDMKLHGVKRQVRADFLSNNGYKERLTYDGLRKMGYTSILTEWAVLRVNDKDFGINEDTTSPGKRYLETFYPNDDAGQLFELAPHFYYDYNVDDYFPTHEPHHWDWAYRGKDKDAYRWNIRIRNHEIQDDYTDIISAVEIFNRIPGIPFATLEEHFDVPQCIGMLAIRAASSNTDFGGRKNSYLYAPASTKKWQWLAWDCESGFSKTSHNLWSGFHTEVQDFVRFQRNQHDYLNVVHQYIHTYLNNEHLDPWIDHYYSVAGGYSPSSCKNYVKNRHAYLSNILAPYVEPATKLVLGIRKTVKSIVTTQDTIELSGFAPVNTSWLRFNQQLYWLDWVDETQWQVRVESPQSSGPEDLEFLDYHQKPIGTITVPVNLE